ncbi:MAG TPA: alpha/beta hydrolase [Woeseiaceae bacterium]|nr:alpha/beta hydrolase [Woeseiaceae bacterium]
MTRRSVRFLLLSIVGTIVPSVPVFADPPQAGTYVTVPDVLTGPDGELQTAERGLFFVPENRAKRGGRIIPIHFLRFASLDANSKQPPVFLLPGGPGSEWDFNEPDRFRDAQRLRQRRDVVYVSQRGNPKAPNLVPPLYFARGGQALDRPRASDRDRSALRKEVQSVQASWSEKGVDLAGYDIVNIVDDVYELRSALAYDQIILRACSFGSQWSLAYLKRWPATVQRAMLSGVEPLDYAYDSPKWLWASMQRLAESAEADPQFAPLVPPDGLMAALVDVIARLEAKPVEIEFTGPTGNEISITIGAYDLQRELRSSFGETNRERYENWPRFILELYNGDYRYLAVLAWQSRNPSRLPMIELLIDNSLGISAHRDEELLQQREARWLGDINASYRNTRDLTLTPVVDDNFRANQEIAVPVLLVNGDLDWSTPLENAKALLPSLQKGHLVTVTGAGHCPFEELEELMPDAADNLYAFIDADLSGGKDKSFFDELPDEITLPQFAFKRPVGPSLYDEWLAAQHH